MRVACISLNRLTKRPDLRLACLAAAAAGFAMDLRAADVPSVAEPQTLMGRWEPRLRMETNGVFPYANLVTEGWANVNGGLKTGAAGSYFLDFGVECDLEKMGGWKGGVFHAEGHWIENWDGGSFEEKTGAFNPVSGVEAGSQIRAYNVFYRQSLMNDRLTIKAGQIAADEDFMLSDYSRFFLNSGFGVMPSQTDFPRFPVWPVAAPGIFVKAKPEKPLYAQVGIYYGKPGDDNWGNHGFDWANQPGPGVGVFYEGGYSFSAFGKKATARLGGTYHTGESPDYSAITATNPNASYKGIASFYAIQDWTLIEDKSGNPRVGVFWRGGIKPEPERRGVGGYTDAGVNWFGPIPGRDHDVAGIAASWTQFGRDFRTFQDNGFPANEQTIEASYKAQVTRWFSVQGDVQCVLNPAYAGSGKTATVLGVRATLSF